MSRDSSTTSRRGFLQHAALLSGAAALGDSNKLFAGLRALAQDPPGSCPAPPVGGTPFTAGSDTRPMALRKAASALTPAEVTRLQDAFAALRALPATDKRTWVLQADLHALYCDSCTNWTKEIHGSWNFFPWHRAYLYYYERILGSLVGDIDHFRIPYWDWTTQRTLPDWYRTPGASTNSLWNANRNGGMAGGGNLPLFDGTASRIDELNMIQDFATFGGDQFSAGSPESDPHGNIHMDVGRPSSPYRDMGNLGYAARDPLFFAHHCNLDKIWSDWNALADPSLPGAYTNPTESAFLNARWSFYDENQQLVAISAADVLDHRNQLRYVYKLRIPDRFRIQVLIWKCRLICCRPGPDPAPFLEVDERVRESVLSAARSQSPILLVLRGVQVPMSAVGNYDVVATDNQRSIRVGTIGVIAHSSVHSKERRPMSLTLDITKAAPGLLSKENPWALRVVPRDRKMSEPFTLNAKSAEIRTQK